MEIEKRQPQMGKKLWNIVRVVLYMMRKKRKIIVDVSTLLKKGRDAGKALSDLTCRPSDAGAAFVSPREYEFSCSNTPLPKRKGHHYHAEDDLRLMQKVFGILSRYDDVVAAEASPVPAPGIDRDAEEFIKKFYRELRKQSPYHEWAT